MTNTEHIRDLFRRLAEAMNSRELEQLDDILTDDFARHCEATPDVVVDSREDFKEFLRTYTLSFPDNVQTFEQVIVEGDMAGFWATYEGTQKGDLGPFSANGKKTKFSFAGVARTQEGRIAEFWVTWDNMTILAQLGHLPGSQPPK
jgi:predicted ester cyclase